MQLEQFLIRLSRLKWTRLVNYVWNQEDVQAEIIRLNTIEQLFNRGIDSNERTLGDYSPVSVQRFGKRAGHIQLFDTGEFYESFKVIVVGVFADIVADPIKEETNLVTEYGQGIIGLTNESKRALESVIRQNIRAYLLQNIR